MEDRVQHQVNAILGTETDSGRAVPVYEHEDGSVRTFNAGDDIDEYIKSVTGDSTDSSGGDGDDDSDTGDYNQGAC